LPGPLRLAAYAKINLTLDVLGDRPDGFHEVAMIMQSIDLHDIVEIQEAPSGISVSSDAGDLACDRTNLAFRAAEAVKNRYDIAKGVKIHLTKRIPLAAGLAGGSSDAAAVLKGLDRLWKLGLSSGELEELAAGLGSDVPFCLWGGTVLATGRGEILNPLPDMPNCGIVLAKMPFEVSTAWVYQNYKAERVDSHPNNEAMMDAISRQDRGAIATGLCNVLESVTLVAYEELVLLKSRMKQAGALGVLMSGSGPTIFAVTADQDTAAELARKIVEPAMASIIACGTVKREEVTDGAPFITS